MKKYNFRSSMLSIPLEMWNKFHELHGDGDFYGTPEEFLDTIGLPSSLSVRTNQEEKEFIDKIYELWRSRQ